MSNLSDKIAALKKRDQELYADGKKDPFGLATYINEEIQAIADKAATITVRYDGMDVISDMLDKHTHKTLELLDEGSRAIQAHANDVVSHFDAFIREGPITIKYDKGDGKAKKEAEEKYAQESQKYLSHIHHIVMDVARFGEVKSSLSGAENLLRMQTNLVDKDEVFTRSGHNATILNLIKFIKQMEEDLNKAKQERDGLIIELRQFLGRKPSEVPTNKGLDKNKLGPFVTRYKAFDPLFFEMAISYITYTMAIYKLEVNARKVTMEITKIKNLQWFQSRSTRPIASVSTQNQIDNMLADIDFTNASLNKSFKKLSSTANNFLEKYDVPDSIKNLPATGKTSSEAIDNAAEDLVTALKNSVL